MSTTSTPTPSATSGDGPGMSGLWTPSSRGVYTYTFLGGIGLIALVVLIFTIKAHIARRRFAIRVQRALDSGRLDPAIVNEIRNLPSSALYLSRRFKPQKPRPLMYEAYLGEPCKTLARIEGDSKLEDGIDWGKIRPIAVTKLISRNPTAPTSTTNTIKTNDTIATNNTNPVTDPPTRRTFARFHFSNPFQSSPRTQSEPRPDPPASSTNQPQPSEANLVSSSDSLVLGVFIAMPSPSSRLSRAKIDGEDDIPEICFGLTHAEVVR